MNGTKTALFAMIAILIFGVAACTTTNTNDGSPKGDSMVIPTDTMDENEDNSIDDGSMTVTDDIIEGSSMEPKIFVITGENFKFLMNGEQAPEIRVSEGDTVRIEFTSTDGFHDWVVDEFDAATEKVQTNGSTFVEFVADKKGTFEYYCSVGQHRANGMKGNLIVE